MFKKIEVFFEDPSFRNLSILFFIGSFFIVATVFSGPFIFARGHPATPTGLRVGAVTDTTVALSWAAGRGTTATDYLVQYQVFGAKTWTTFNDGRNTNTNTIVTGLTTGTRYSFRVAASNRDGDSAYTSKVSTTTLTVSGDPTSLTVAAVTDSTVALSWTAPSDNGGASITDYTVQYKVNGARTWITFSDVVSTNTTTTVTSLSAATQYNFQVAAVNSVGASSYSSSVSGTTSTTVTEPGVPTSLTVGAITDTTVALSWTAPSDNGGASVTDYIIQSNGGSWITFSDGVSANTNTTVTGLTPTSTYAFKVAAVNSVGAGSYSSSASTSTISAVSAINSTLRVSRNKVEADGKNEVRITVTTLDDSDNAVSGVDVILYSSQVGPIFTSIGTTDISGIFSTTIKHGAILDTTLSVRADGILINDTKSIGFKKILKITDHKRAAVSNGARLEWSSNKSVATSTLKIGFTGWSPDTEEIFTGDIKSFSVSNLLACSRYEYLLDTEDIDGLEVTDTDKKYFTTKGCLGSATIEGIVENKITKAAGGEINFDNANRDVNIIIPINVSTDNDNIHFTAKKLNREEFWNSIPLPQNSRSVGDTFQFDAYKNSTSTLEIFDNAITIKMNYENSDILGLNEGNLVIKRYDDTTGQWETLNGCSVNTNINEVSCTTYNFSGFGIFGQSTVTSGTTSFSLNPMIMPQGGYRLYVNEGAESTNSREVKLSFNTGSDITKIAISNYIDMSDASIQGYQEEMIWDLCSTNNSSIKEDECLEGQYSIFVKFYNDYGKSSDIIMNSIDLGDKVGDNLDNNVINNIFKYFDNLLEYFTYNNKNYFILSKDQLEQKGFFEEEAEEEVEEEVVLEENIEELIMEEITEDKDNIFYSFTKYLYYGIEGDEVKNLQNLLKDLGYFIHDKLTGYYGFVTRKAVMEFQKDNDLPSVGVVGPLTRKLLEEVQK